MNSLNISDWGYFLIICVTTLKDFLLNPYEIIIKKKKEIVALKKNVNLYVTTNKLWRRIENCHLLCRVRETFNFSVRHRTDRRQISAVPSKLLVCQMNSLNISNWGYFFLTICVTTLNDFLLNPYEILIKEKKRNCCIKAKTYSGQTENDTI
jgi:hypothetical protein